MVKAAAASVLFVLTKYSSLERATKVGYIVHMYMYKKYIYSLMYLMYIMMVKTSTKCTTFITAAAASAPHVLLTLFILSTN